jgi:hypothetical protein
VIVTLQTLWTTAILDPHLPKTYEEGAQVMRFSADTYDSFLNTLIPTTHAMMGFAAMMMNMS